MSRNWFRWRTLRVSNNPRLNLRWWPLVRFGRYPRIALWVVVYDNPQDQEDTNQ
jgi:hypothetical protein